MDAALSERVSAKFMAHSFVGMRRRFRVLLPDTRHEEEEEEVDVSCDSRVATGKGQPAVHKHIYGIRLQGHLQSGLQCAFERMFGASIECECV